MKFVIELDDFMCGATECQVVRRGWKAKQRHHDQLDFFIKIQVGQVEVELYSDQIEATKTPERRYSVPNHTTK
jgi:hypothetical protein